jgi:glucose uptake protein
MFIIQNHGTAVLFCLVTMLCWGSWANTQKLAAANLPR